MLEVLHILRARKERLGGVMLREASLDNLTRYSGEVICTYIDLLYYHPI